MLARLIDREEGLGMITAVAVAFVLFSLSAVWFAVSVHSSETQAADGFRSQSLFVADSAAREAMAQVLASDGAWTGHGEDPLSPGMCAIQTLESQGDSLGQYFTEVEDLGDRQYLIHSWAWTPGTDAVMSKAKKVTLEAQIVAGSFFDRAVFAGSGVKPKDAEKGKFKLEKVDKLVLYGDGYFGNAKLKDVKFFDNGAHPGDGNLVVDGYLHVDKDKSVFVEGDTIVRYKIYDDGDKRRHTYNGDVYILEDTGLYDEDKFKKLGTHEIYMENSTVEGTIWLPQDASVPSAATIDPSSRINGTEPPAAPDVDIQYFDPADAPAEIPSYDLPPIDIDAFTPTVMPNPMNESDFKSWFEANKGDLKGIVKVVDPDKKIELNMKDAVITGDFTLVANVKEIKIKEAGRAKLPSGRHQVSIMQFADEVDGKVKLEKHSQTNENLLFFLYSNRTLEIKDRAVIYGAAYAEAIKSKSGPNVIHYRSLSVPVDSNGDSALEFDDPTELWAIRPNVWRESGPDAAPTTCTLPS